MSQKIRMYQKLREGERINLVEGIPLDGPLTIYLETTNICNYRCVFCPESFDNYKAKAGGFFTLGFNDLKRIADEIKDLKSVITLNLHMMGEPFINKQLTRFISYAKQNEIAKRIILTSNGSLIDPSKYQQLIDSKLDFLRISVGGGDEINHKKNIQSACSLSKVRDNIIGLKEHRDKTGSSFPYIYIKMIESVNSLENSKFLEYFDGVGDEICLESIMNWNDPADGNLSNTNNNAFVRKPNSLAIKKACPFPFYTLVIHADLKVSVCCVDWDKQTVVGDMHINTLKEIWNGKKLQEFQLKHIQHKRSELSGCKNCTYIHTSPDNIDDLSSNEFLERSK